MIHTRECLFGLVVTTGKLVQVPVCQQQILHPYPLLESHVLHHSQFGFHHRHSTTSLLTTVVNDWAKALDNHFSVHSVFIDFAKAFDSMPHK